MQVKKQQLALDTCSWQGKNKCAPGNDSSLSSQAHGDSVRATAEPQSQQWSQRDAPSAQATLPEAQAEAGIGREDCLEAGPLSVAPWVLLRVELCPLPPPNLCVDILTPQCLRI